MERFRDIYGKSQNRPFFHRNDFYRLANKDCTKDARHWPCPAPCHREKFANFGRTVGRNEQELSDL